MLGELMGCRKRCKMSSVCYEYEWHENLDGGSRFA
jgi:hypothetical protein